jgi:hypothetical protein
MTLKSSSRFEWIFVEMVSMTSLRRFINVMTVTQKMVMDARVSELSRQGTVENHSLTSEIDPIVNLNAEMQSGILIIMRTVTMGMKNLEMAEKIIELLTVDSNESTMHLSLVFDILTEEMEKKTILQPSNNVMMEIIWIVMGEIRTE